MEISTLRFEGEDEFAMEQRQETALMFAISYMNWVDEYLNDVEKAELRLAIANFNENGNITHVYQILNRTKILDDDQMDIIIDCLYHSILRTRFIINLCAKDLLKCVSR